MFMCTHNDDPFEAGILCYYSCTYPYLIYCIIRYRNALPLSCQIYFRQSHYLYLNWWKAENNINTLYPQPRQQIRIGERYSPNELFQYVTRCILFQSGLCFSFWNRELKLRDVSTRFKMVWYRCIRIMSLAPPLELGNGSRAMLLPQSHMYQVPLSK